MQDSCTAAANGNMLGSHMLQCSFWLNVGFLREQKAFGQEIGHGISSDWQPEETIVAIDGGIGKCGRGRPDLHEPFGQHIQDQFVFGDAHTNMTRWIPDGITGILQMLTIVGHGIQYNI